MIQSPSSNTVSLSSAAPSLETRSSGEDTEPAKAFELLFVSQIVDEMMKTVDMGSTMGEHPSEMWRSVISQSLAERLADGGGVGIAENVQRMLKAYNAAQDGKSS